MKWTISVILWAFTCYESDCVAVRHSPLANWHLARFGKIWQDLASFINIQAKVANVLPAQIAILFSIESLARIWGENAYWLQGMQICTVFYRIREGTLGLASTWNRAEYGKHLICARVDFQLSRAWISKLFSSGAASTVKQLGGGTGTH